MYGEVDFLPICMVAFIWPICQICSLLRFSAVHYKMKGQKLAAIWAIHMGQKIGKILHERLKV